MSRRIDGGKITLGMLKGKPITTSVPSFSIRFHAGGEELEELYPSEEEEKSEISEKFEKSSIVEEKTSDGNGPGETNKHESSPMRDYLNKFGKRSSSIDTGINESTLGQQTAASDPWRLFSEFKGKITKTVEEKLSEIKSKNNEGENSPKHVYKSDKSKTTSKENSSISDSEEQSFSECSIAKSSGLSSTAEDIEMSSDDENSLAESEKTPTENSGKEFGSDGSSNNAKKHILRHRNKNTKSYVQFCPGKDPDTECQVKITSLSTVHEKEDVLPENDVESGVEAYEEFISSNKETLPQFIPDAITMIAPTGFVDLRPIELEKCSSIFSYQSPVFWWLLVCFIAVCIVAPIPRFLLGLVIGSVLSASFCYLYYKFILKDADQTSKTNLLHRTTPVVPELSILEIHAVKEYQPVKKFEGWMNEYPEQYDARSYHIMKTQSVFLKLENSVLRIYHTRSKIPKRAMWDEPKHNVIFTHTRMYNLRGSQVTLLPAGLIHKRLWSKKYPICIILNKEKMNLELNVDKKDDLDNESDHRTSTKPSTTSNKDNEVYADPIGDTVDDSSYLESDHHQIIDVDKEFFSDPSFSDTPLEEEKDETSINADDWDTLTLDEICSTKTKIYLFARTCRDKEDWYRRLVIATRDITTEVDNLEDDSLSLPSATHTTESTATPNAANGSSSTMSDNGNNAEQIAASPSVTDSPRRKRSETVDDEEDYLRYMARFNQVLQKIETPSPHARSHRRKLLRFRRKKSPSQTTDEEEAKEEHDCVTDVNNSWLNSFIARVFYDFCRHEKVINNFHELIQRKLSTIKLPYFIENIVMTDLSVGKSSPTIHHIYEPHLDERGLWIYMNITYEGVTSMAIVTKLNLMKLKEHAGKMEDSLNNEIPEVKDSIRSPIYHSDIEDSAESSDEESSAAWTFTSNASETNQNLTPRKPNTGGKKFLLMVDKIASSKYFQQATELKYIKRAMEGLSKTEIKLTVEVQYLAGTLALNIPPPPSDRVWIGFRGNPELQLSATPTFGERSINYVSRWIEKKLAVEFQKFLVLPNMEDFVLPVMIPNLPE